MCVSPGFIKHNAFKMRGLSTSSGLPLSVSLGTASDYGPKSTAALSRVPASLLPRRPRSCRDLTSRGTCFCRADCWGSPVSPSAGPGTSEEPAAVCGRGGSAIKNENCPVVITVYKAGHCSPGESLFILISLPREAAWLVAPFYRIKKRGRKVICPKLGRGFRIRIQLVSQPQRPLCFCRIHESICCKKSIHSFIFIHSFIHY